MPLVLHLVNSSPIPLEVDAVRMEIVRTQSADEVLRTLVQHGNRQQPLGEFFRAEGSAKEDETIVWQGDCAKVKLIGSELRTGRMIVEGNAGMHLGADMVGGEIEVHGNAADWAGAEMRGGRIRIHGDAGDCVGGVYRGGRRGMTGGEIFINGNAGTELGNTMRRGLIVVRGKAGDAIGFNMLAGSIFVFGEAGIRQGAGMRRGTIALFQPTSPQLLPSFKFSDICEPGFLSLYLRYLVQQGFAVPEECLRSRYRRYCGDMLELGKGEILTRAV